eukprot:gene21554-22449_t
MRVRDMARCPFGENDRTVHNGAGRVGQGRQGELIAVTSYPSALKCTPTVVSIKSLTKTCHFRDIMHSVGWLRSQNHNRGRNQMSTVDTVRQLLADAAAQADIIDTVVEGEGARFEIGLTDNGSILVEFDPGSGRLMLTTAIGQPPAERRAEVLELLMSYNALWLETGGVRAASGGRDEPMLLMIDVFVFGLSADQIARLVENFAGRARLWSGFVTAGQTFMAIGPDLTNRAHIKLTDQTSLRDLKDFTDKLGSQSLRAFKTKDGDTILYAKSGDSSFLSKLFGIASRRQNLAKTEIQTVLQRYQTKLEGDGQLQPGTYFQDVFAKTTNNYSLVHAERTGDDPLRARDVRTLVDTAFGIYHNLTGKAEKTPITEKLAGQLGDHVTTIVHQFAEDLKAGKSVDELGEKLGAALELAVKEHLEGSEQSPD